MDSIKICLCLMCNVEWRQDNAMEDHGMENVIIGVAEERTKDCHIASVCRE